MSFFDSNLVKKELEEITVLQEKIYENVFKFPAMNSDEKIGHIELLESLLDKQKILYTRVSLSEDSEAVQLKQQIIESAILMGMPKDKDIKVIFNNMSIMLTMMRKQIIEQNS